MKKSYIVLIVLLLSTISCGLPKAKTIGESQQTENEFNNTIKQPAFGSEVLRISKEPNINDVIKTWEWKPQNQNLENLEDYTIVQIWENRRNDYIATHVYFDINLYAPDGSILKTETKDISIGRGSSWPISFTIHNDTGSRSTKAEVLVTSVEWKLHNSETDKQELDISRDPYINKENTEIEIQITNSSDYLLSNAQITYLLLTNNDVPFGIASSAGEDAIAYGQSQTLNTFLIPLFWDWVNADKNLIITDNKIKTKYWISYDSYFDERITLYGEKTLEIPVQTE